MCHETKTDLFDPDPCFCMMLQQQIQTKAEWRAFFIKIDFSQTE